MNQLLDVLIGNLGMGLSDFFMLCGVAFLGSFLTVALGIGGGVLVLATMAQVLPPTVLVPIHGVVQLGSNISRAFLMRRYILTSIVPAFLTGTIIGALLGAKLVFSLSMPLLQIILALFILYSVWMPKFSASSPGKSTFFAVGFGATLVTMFVGATGVLVSPFVSAACPDRQQYVGTHGALMTLQHSLKIIAFGALGFTYGPYIPLLCGMIVFGYAGTWCGAHVLLRIPEKAFRIGLKFVLTILACRLIYGAMRSYLE